MAALKNEMWTRYTTSHTWVVFVADAAPKGVKRAGIVFEQV